MSGSTDPRSGLTRADILRRAALAGVAVASVDLARLPSLAGAAAGAAPTPRRGATVKYFCWQGNDPAKAKASFKRLYGVTVKPSYIAGDQEVFTKLGAQKGKGLWDVLGYNSGLAPQLFARDLLEPLSPSEVPNFANVYPEFRGLPQIRAGQGNRVIGVPFTWGYQGFIRTPKLARLSSWSQIFDPKLKGRIVGVNDPTTSIATMAVALGFKNYANLTKAQLEKVMDGWERLRPNLRTIVSDYGVAKDLLVRGEIDGCVPGWQAMVVWASGDGKKLVHDIPREGVYGFLDLLCVVKGTKERDSAVAWVNHLLGATAQAELATTLAQGVTNRKAVPKISKQLRIAYDYANLRRNFARAPIRPLPSNASGGKFVSFADWAEAWEKFVAG